MAETKNPCARISLDLRLFPMSPEQFERFQKHAKKQKILFSAIKDRDGRGRMIDVVVPVARLDRANLILSASCTRAPPGRPQSQLRCFQRERREEYRARLDGGRKSVPIREKTRTKPKVRHQF